MSIAPDGYFTKALPHFERPISSHETAMKSIILDGNIYDLLLRDGATLATLRRCIDSGAVRVLITRTLAEELRRSPFGGVPQLFQTERVGDTVGRVRLMRCGDRLGYGHVFTAHKGVSNQVNDALIADAADCLATWLVSEDARLRRRLLAVSIECLALSYEEFWAALKGCEASL